MKSDSVQRIKDTLSIIEVVSPYVKLTRAGKYYRGLSPFGSEKTPSFYVSPDRGSYYCFSTSQGGDHFSFVQAMEGVDFKGALKILAEKAGVELRALRPEDVAARDQTERVRSAMLDAEALFVAGLAQGTSAYQYAQERGLTATSLIEWKLGVAPEGWRNLLEVLQTKGYSNKELEAAGLIKEADGKPGTWYDRFRERLMFPIRDAAGRTVAFTGRALNPSDTAKYLNSPETVLYRKSEVLFGMDRAKDAIRKLGYAILVEGQFDLVLLHQAGFTNTIALSGTALSTTHLSLIKRYADNLMLCLDADRAGLAASARNAHAALLAGMRVKAVRLPEGKDPADIVSTAGGAKRFADMVKESQPIVDYFMSVLAGRERDELKLLRQVEGVVLPLVAAIKSPLEQNRFVESVARALSSTPEAVRASLPPQSTRIVEAVPQNESKASQHTSEQPSMIEMRRTLICAAIATYPDTEVAETLKNEYNRITGAPAPTSDLDERALFEAGLVFGETPDPGVAQELIYAFERMTLTDALRDATARLRRAESSNNQESITQAAHDCVEISKRLANLSA